MKKLLSVLSMVFVLFILCSCSDNSAAQITGKDMIRYVKIEESSGSTKTYRTIYVYSFKDAETSTPSGYFYSKEKLTIGTSVGIGSGNAIVDKLIDAYDVKIDRKDDMYTITYYYYRDENLYVGSIFNVVSDKKDLEPLKMAKIETYKDRVIIYYDTD